MDEAAAVAAAAAKKEKELADEVERLKQEFEEKQRKKDERLATAAKGAAIYAHIREKVRARVFLTPEADPD